jgi:hypothetical protein
MRRLTEDYKSKGVIVLDINMMDDEQVVKQFLVKHGTFGSQVLLTSDESVMKAFNVEDFPSTIVIDQLGKIQAAVSGEGHDDLAAVQQALRRLTVAPSFRHKLPDQR